MSLCGIVVVSPSTCVHTAFCAFCAVLLRLLKGMVLIIKGLHFRSTLRQSRPNKPGLKCPSVRACVRMYVRPQKVLRFQ